MKYLGSIFWTSRISKTTEAGNTSCAQGGKICKAVWCQGFPEISRSKTYLWRQPSQFREKIIYLPQIEIAEPEIQPPEMPKTELLPPPPPITFKIISKKEKKEKSPPKPAILIKKPIPQLIHRNPYRGFPLPKFVRYKLTP